MENIYLCMGSNVGNRENYLREAINEFKNDNSIKIKNISSVFETEPVGVINQPLFLNLVLDIKTSYLAEELLYICKNIEKKIGRISRNKWHEREIDIDIIFFNDMIIETDTLTIPHPELYNRQFVLIPLSEIAPNFKCPKSMETIKQILFKCQDKSEVKKYQLNVDIN
jgi:2-amino-4-hydroxy-6-hydroxymethyldihydropteridine diphosphokinase